MEAEITYAEVKFKNASPTEEVEEEAQHILSNTGLSSPTEDKSCYYFSDDWMPWDKSQQNCSGMGSQLGWAYQSLQSVRHCNAEYPQCRHTLGQCCDAAEAMGCWRDHQGFSCRCFFWKRRIPCWAGEPSDDPNELCVVIHHNTENLQNWNDVPCTTRSSRICETAAATL
uniref:C-type lectin domain-containing protein n=1 Tax=Anas zonorhyncha TaxID=75864 RepID=A0A8B9U0I7_9AVES